MHRRLLVVLLILTAGGGLLLVRAHPWPPQAAAQSTPFMETFDGMPTTPQPWLPPGWDVQKHQRGLAGAFRMMDAQHSGTCAAADGDPTTTDTMIAYLKQIINTLEGTAGIVTFPSAAAPGNGVSLAEALRAVYDETAGLNGGALLDAAGVRAAVGLAAANLDTQLDALPTAAENADAVWDESIIGHNVTQSFGKVAAFGFVVDGSINNASATAIGLAGGGFADDMLNDYLIVVRHLATNEQQSRWIADFASVGQIATLDEALPFTTTPTDDTYVVYAIRRDVAGSTAPTVAEIWEELIASHSGVSGSMAEALAAAGGAGDPWITALPGAYSAGQAGFIVGTNLDGAVTSRASQASVDTIDGNVDSILAAVDTEVAAIKAKTDNLPVDPADQSAVEAAITASQMAILADTDDIQARLPAALVAGRMDASVGAIAADVLTAAAIAADAATEIATAVWVAGTRTLTGIASGVLSSAALNDIADSLLDRNMATGTDSGSTSVRTVRQALRALRNRVAVAAGTATVYKENDVSVSWSAAVTTTAGDPISEIDPAGP